MIMRWYVKAQVQVQAPPKRLAPQEIANIVAPLKGLNYAVVGGAAMALHGHPRPTGDVDILMPQSEMQEALSRLGGQATPLATGGFSITVGPYEVDLVAYPDDRDPSQDAPWVQEALFSAKQGPHGRVISKPWLMAVKMMAGRDKDFNDYIDVYRMMSVDERKQARSAIGNHMPNMYEDYRQVAQMAKLMPQSPAPSH